ncbi:MAG: FHA domain-containing protein [Bradymonadia bacterium]
MMFRDPRKVVQDRINMRIQNAQMRAKSQVRGAGVRVISAGERKAKQATDNAKAKAKGKGQKAAPNQAPQQATAEKKKFSLWPFGKNKQDAAGQAPACHSCGQAIDPSWELCPYCGTSLAEAPAPQAQMQAAPVPGAPVPAMPQMTGNKTQAINLDELAGPQKMVVGWLVIMEGNEKGRDFRLYEGQNSIGAAADCNIVVNDEYLSAHHASIRFDDGRYELIDKDSTNGCFLNEKRISREELVDNDTIRLGRTHLRFKAIY